MPELPEVESIVRGLRPRITDKVIEKADVLEPRVLQNTIVSEFESALVGQSVSKVKRRGKFMVFVLNNGFRLITHLRMTGNYRYFSYKQIPGKHTHVTIDFEDGAQLHYKDQRRFGRLALYKPDIKIETLEKLGPEPLGPDFSPRYLQNKSGQRKISVKQLLLDQSVIAGIGNIYASEILFDCAVSPFTPVNQLKTADFKRLVESARKILNKAVKCLGTTFSDYRTSDGEKGGFQECLQVYGRAGRTCFRCGGPVKRAVQGQRATFYCPRCQ